MKTIEISSHASNEKIQALRDQGYRVIFNM